MAEIINVELEQEVELQTSYELSGGIIPTGTINITTNGTHDVTTYASANVNVQGGITPTGTKEIEVDAAGTITEDVTNYASVEVTVPQGQYKPNIDATPTNPSISVSNGGLITAEVMTQYVNDLLKPSFTEGYVKSSDVSMKVKIGGSATQQLNTVNGQTVTPTTSTQYIAVQGDYVLGAINVAPIPSEYIVPTGTKSISANGTGIDVKAYEFVDVSVSGGGGGGGSDTIDFIYYTGSGVDKTSIPFDCMNHDAYYTIPFDSTSTYIVSGATASTEGLKIYDTRLYSDADCTNLVGYYQIDTGTISQSARAMTNCPWFLLGTEYKVCPHGYYGKIMVGRSGTDLFSSNGNVLSYINAYGKKLTMKYVGARILTGSVTFVSDITVTNNGTTVLDFGLTSKPDAFVTWYDKTSFDGLESLPSNPYYGFKIAEQDATFPLLRYSNTQSWQSYFGNNPLVAANASVSTNSEGLLGQTPNVNIMARGLNSGQPCTLNADGTITLSSYTWASRTMPAGVWHYVAIYGATFPVM